MPVRRFNGTSDNIRFPTGSAMNISGAVTQIVLVRIETDGASRTFAQLHNKAGEGTGYDIYREASNKFSFYNGSGSVQESSLELKAADGWLGLAITKAAGTVIPKYYRYKYAGETFTSAEGPGTYSDGLAPSTEGTLRLGEFQGGLWHKGDIAAVGIWGEALTEAQIKECIVTAKSLESWKTIGTCKGLFLLNQTEVTTLVVDSSGNGNTQSSRSGTTVISEEPPIPYIQAAGGAPLMPLSRRTKLVNP